MPFSFGVGPGISKRSCRPDSKCCNLSSQHNHSTPVEISVPLRVHDPQFTICDAKWPAFYSRFQTDGNGRRSRFKKRGLALRGPALPPWNERLPQGHTRSKANLTCSIWSHKTSTQSCHRWIIPRVRPIRPHDYQIFIPGSLEAKTDDSSLLRQARLCVMKWWRWAQNGLKITPCLLPLRTTRSRIQTDFWRSWHGVPGAWTLERDQWSSTFNPRLIIPREIHFERPGSPSGEVDTWRPALFAPCVPVLSSWNGTAAGSRPVLHHTGETAR